MHRLIPLVMAAGCLGLLRLSAEDAAPPVDRGLPAYTPRQQVAGELVLWGDDAFEKQMSVWAPAFRAKQPNLTVRWFLKGTSTAIGALYTGTAQIGLYGREIRPLEITAWKRIFPYEPLGFSIATGGYQTYNGTNAVAVFVNRDNPLRHLSLQQLDAIYSRQRRRGAPAAIRTWGQLGLTGEWAARPITVYGLDEPTGTAQFMQARVLLEGPWAYDIRLPKGAPDKMYAGSGNAAALALVKALATDPGAIGLASFYNADPAIRALAIGEDNAGPFVEGTEATVLNRTYPLSRLVYLFVNKDPHQPWDPKVYEFIQFVLSRDGQAGVAAVNTYHPLPSALLAQERLKLGDLPAAAPSAAWPRPRPQDTEVWSPEPAVVTPAPAPGGPPSDAIVLFDGHSLDPWVASADQRSPAGWLVANGMATVNKRAGNIETRRKFRDYQLHLEYRIPADITGSSQARGNSGLFLASTGRGDEGYELQILDSYGNKTYVNGMAGSVYKQSAPLVNACLKPGDWQTYDVVWTAPRFKADGALDSPARLVVLFNGVLVQNNFALRGETRFIGPPAYTAYDRAPIKLQAHHDPSQPISFRNIWVRELP